MKITMTKKLPTKTGIYLRKPFDGWEGQNVQRFHLIFLEISKLNSHNEKKLFIKADPLSDFKGGFWSSEPIEFEEASATSAIDRHEIALEMMKETKKRLNPGIE